MSQKEKIGNEMLQKQWSVKERPGYLGKNREAYYHAMDEKYGPGKWRLANIDTTGKEYTIQQIVFEVYAESYAQHFREHEEDLHWITENFSHAYELDEYPVSVEDATNLDLYYNKPGVPNQFHAVAMNHAIMNLLQEPMRGEKPLRVYPPKKDSPEEEWPAGWKWHPGRIPVLESYATVMPELDREDPDVYARNKWWLDDDRSLPVATVEAFYQSTKAVQVES